MLSYAVVLAERDVYFVPNRRKHKKALSADRLPYIELRLLDLVEEQMGGRLSHPYISLKCWLLGLTPAMTVTEAERQEIRTIADLIHVSIRNER